MTTLPAAVAHPFALLLLPLPLLRPGPESRVLLLQPVDLLLQPADRLPIIPMPRVGSGELKLNGMEQIAPLPVDLMGDVALLREEVALEAKDLESFGPSVAVVQILNEIAPHCQQEEDSRGLLRRGHTVSHRRGHTGVEGPDTQTRLARERARESKRLTRR